MQDNKLKFVVTHVDEIAVYFTIWEETQHGWNRCASTCMERTTYEAFHKILKESGILKETELKLEVNDDDIPIEIKTPKGKGIHSGPRGVQEQSGNKYPNDEHSSRAAEERPTEREAGHTLRGDREIDYGG